MTRRSLARRLRPLVRAEQWNVGIVDAPIHAFLEPGRSAPVQWFPRAARRLSLADPFGVQWGDRLVILAEQWDYRTRHGRIVALERRPDGSLSGPDTVLELGVHVSYPYLVQEEDGMYCIPETSQMCEVALYRTSTFPRAWSKVGVLIQGMQAVDPTVFRYEGRWWLLLADRDRGRATRLHAWYAPALRGPWAPHADNPIKTDPRSSRPGGTPFEHEGQLYRPAQDDSRTYGGAVVLNRVVRLTPTEFHEDPVRVVEPDPRGPYPGGLHTLSAAGEVTLVDGKRNVFVWDSFRHEARRRLRGLSGRLRVRPVRGAR